MHYIRLLRPARLCHDLSGRRRPFVSLLVTITTDLGDSFLYPDEPVDLIVVVEYGVSVDTTVAAVAETPPPTRWAAGMRVLDLKVPLKPHVKREDVTCTIVIYSATALQSDQSPPRGGAASLGSEHVLPWRVPSGDSSSVRRGLIMPATVEMVAGTCSPVSVRRLRLNTTGAQTGSGLQDVYVHLEEDIGESIARHVWDAGVVTACFLADACRTAEDARAVLPITRDDFNVLELGCGVGILGLTIASILDRAAAAQDQTLRGATVLLTDLAEAEERARSNISKVTPPLSRGLSKVVVATAYENLDWDEGRHGRFGPLVSARRWDLVVLSDCTYNVDSLPALVGTLTALHVSNAQHQRLETTEGDAKTTVMLATKPRHSSEKALFGLLEADGWRYSVLKSIPLPKLGEEDERVDVYLLEKG